MKRNPKRAKRAKLYEISALVKYSVVILANTKKEALAEVETWEHAWDSNADLIGVSDVELLEVRDGDEDDAHITLTQNRRLQRQARNK